MKWIAIASIALAIAAGGYAFWRDQAATARIAQVEAEMQKAQAEVGALRAERDALRKSMADLTLEAQQLRSDAEVAGRFLEAEKAMNARLREDLAMTTARLAAAGSRQARKPDALPPGVLPPGLMLLQRPPPIAVRAAPGGSAAAVAAPAPAPAR